MRKNNSLEVFRQAVHVVCAAKESGNFEQFLTPFLRRFWFMRDNSFEGKKPPLFHICGDAACLGEVPTDDNLLRVLDGGEDGSAAQSTDEIDRYGRTLGHTPGYRPCAMIVPAARVVDLLPVMQRHIAVAAHYYPSVVVLLVDETVELEAIAPVIGDLRLHVFPSFVQVRPTWTAELLPKVVVEEQQKLHERVQRMPEMELCATFTHNFDPCSLKHCYEIGPFIQKACTNNIRERTHPEPRPYRLDPEPFDEETFETWLTPTCASLTKSATKSAARCD